MTGTYNLTGAYNDVLTASQRPNPTVTGYSFIPNPHDYQGWLFSDGSTPPGGGYDPFHIWTGATAYNTAGVQGGMTGWLGDPYNENVNGSVTSNTGGTLWAIFQWNGASPPPVDHLDILLQTTVRANADPQGNGLTSSATATDSTFNETASAPGGVPLIRGRHLLRVPVDPNTGQAQVSLGGTTTVTASNSLPFGVMGSYPGTTSGGYYYQTNGSAAVSASASIGATASFDSREVSIISPTIEDSYYKGAYDSQHGTNRYLHQRSKDGSIQTDSAAFYSTADNNHGWNGKATFVANTPGFTNPTYSWSSDFNPVAMLDVDTHQSSIAGSWYFGGADTLPKSSTVTLNVQDGPGTDNAQASNTFDIKWHLPYEAPNPVPYLVMAGKYSLQPARVGPVPDGQTTLVQPTQPKHIDWDATIDGAAVVAKVAGQEEIAGGLEIVGAIAKVAKPYTDVDAEPKQENGATNGPTTWGDAQSENREIYTGGNVPDSLKDNPDGWRLCNMYIFQVVHFKDKYWYADGYTSHGYDGNSQHVVYLRNIDSVYDEFQFIQYKNPDGSPVSS